MSKRLKKIKVKKTKKPRQPRRAGVPRKPPVTNISVNISGGSNQPSGSYYFPNAQQQMQPAINNLFNPVLNNNLINPVPNINLESIRIPNSSQTDATPLRIGRSTQSEDIFELPNELPPGVTERRPRAAGGGRVRFNEDDLILPPSSPPPSPLYLEQQSPAIRIIRPAPRMPTTPSSAAGGGVGSRGGLTTLNQQQIHDLARSMSIPVQNAATGKARSMKELKDDIKYQRSKE